MIHFVLSFFSFIMRLATTTVSTPELSEWETSLTWLIWQDRSYSMSSTNKDRSSMYDYLRLVVTALLGIIFKLINYINDTNKMWGVLG